jgi:hypothetical protein
MSDTQSAIQAIYGTTTAVGLSQQPEPLEDCQTRTSYLLFVVYGLQYQRFFLNSVYIINQNRLTCLYAQLIISLRES